MFHSLQVCNLAAHFAGFVFPTSAVLRVLRRLLDQLLLQRAAVLNRTAVRRRARLRLVVSLGLSSFLWDLSVAVARTGGRLACPATQRCLGSVPTLLDDHVASLLCAGLRRRARLRCILSPGALWFLRHQSAAVARTRGRLIFLAIQRRLFSVSSVVHVAELVRAWLFVSLPQPARASSSASTNQRVRRQCEFLSAGTVLSSNL